MTKSKNSALSNIFSNFFKIKKLQNEKTYVLYIRGVPEQTHEYFIF